MVVLSLIDKSLYFCISTTSTHMHTDEIPDEKNDTFPTTNPPVVGVMFIIFAN